MQDAIAFLGNANGDTVRIAELVVFHREIGEEAGIRNSQGNAHQDAHDPPPLTWTIDISGRLASFGRCDLRAPTSDSSNATRTIRESFVGTLVSGEWKMLVAKNLTPYGAPPAAGIGGGTCVGGAPGMPPIWGPPPPACC